MIYPDPIQNPNTNQDEVAKLQLSVRTLRERNERLITKLAELHRLQNEREFNVEILKVHFHAMKSAIGLVLHDHGMEQDEILIMLLMFTAKYHQIVAEVDEQEEPRLSHSKSIAA